jgi:regulator of protease activity HflC (stomatin/prohibitin superfamily)
VIKESEAVKQQQINEAQGEAEAIMAVARATAEGLREVAAALTADGGTAAMQLRVAEDYVQQFGNLAKSSNTLVVPATLSDVSSMIAMATKVFEGSSGSNTPPAPSPRSR